MATKTCLDEIKPLYKLCAVFGLVPPHHIGEDVNCVSKFFKCYTVATIIVTLAMSLHSHIGRVGVVYPSFEPTMSVTDRIMNYALTLLNVTIRIVIIWIKGESTKAFFNKIDNILQRKEFGPSTRKALRNQFIFFHILMLLMMVSDALLWTTSVGIKIFKFYISRSVLFYMNSLMLLLISQSALIIKHCFETSNIALESTVKNLLCTNSSRLVTSARSKFDNCSTVNNQNLKKFGKLYGDICDLIDQFNCLFGYVILLSTLVVIVSLLNMTNVLVFYAIARNNQFQGVEYGINLLFVCVLWIVTNLISAVFLAFSCGLAIAESKKTVTICYNYLNEIPTVPKTDEDVVMKEELTLLAQQMVARNPKFSAGGFLEVNCNLIGFILGTVTSYIIVTMQFITTN